MPFSYYETLTASHIGCGIGGGIVGGGADNGNVANFVPKKEIRPGIRREVDHDALLDIYTGWYSWRKNREMLPRREKLVRESLKIRNWSFSSRYSLLPYSPQAAQKC